MRSISFIIFIFIFSCSPSRKSEPHVLIETSLGEIELELYPSKAPLTVAAFLRNIESGVYHNGCFYRVLKADELPSDFNSGIIQGGVWQIKSGEQKGITKIPHESTKLTGLLHTDGVISMARTDTGTASTEFFICIGNQPAFDYGGTGNPDGQGFAAFGTVVKGMSVVKKIQAKKSMGDRFVENVAIRKIIIQ